MVCLLPLRRSLRANQRQLAGEANNYPAGMPCALLVKPGSDGRYSDRYGSGGRSHEVYAAGGRRPSATTW
jgi:hypothetical protein